jgi:hypothetical protein
VKLLSNCRSAQLNFALPLVIRSMANDDGRQTGEKWRSRTVLAGIVILTLIGLGLRLYRLPNQSFWVDEISSVATAQVPLAEILERSAVENSLPPYFLVLRAIVDGRHGDLEARARLPSAVAGGLSVPLFVWLIYLWRSSWRTALLAGLLLAINPLHIWYSQETRAYALMLLAGLCVLISFEKARATGGARWWVLYCLFAATVVSLHKIGLVFPLSCAAWDFWRVIREHRRLSNLGPHLVLLVVVAIFLAQRSHPPPERSSSPLEMLYTAMTFIGGYTFGPPVIEIQNEGPRAAVLHHLAEAGILTVATAMICVLFVLRFRTALAGKEVIVLGIGIAVPVVGVLLSGFPYNVRYALPALVGFLAMVALLLTNSHYRAFANITAITILGVGLWSDYQWFFARQYGKGDSRAAARWLINHEEIVKSWTILPEYLSFSVKWYLASEPKLLSAYEPAKEPQTTSFPPVPDVLIIGRRHHVSEPDRLIEAYRAAAGDVQKIDSVTGFEIYTRHSGPSE